MARRSHGSLAPYQPRGGAASRGYSVTTTGYETPRGVYVETKGLRSGLNPWALAGAFAVVWYAFHPTEFSTTATSLRAALAAPTQPAAKTAVGQAAMAANGTTGG